MPSRHQVRKKSQMAKELDFQPAADVWDLAEWMVVAQSAAARVSSININSAELLSRNNNARLIATGRLKYRY